MKPTAFILLAALGLSACTNYQPSKANCFNAGTVTRNANSFSFLASQNEQIVSRNAGLSDCAFTPLGGETEPGVQ